jgi:hypothetical protein
MARLAVGALFGLVVGTVLGAALGLHAETDPTDETVAAATEAGLDPMLVQGAVNSQPGLDARAYLQGIGLLPTVPLSASPLGAAVAGDGRPTVSGSDWPIGGALGQRIWCIEGIESRHGQAMYNPTPVGREHAQGYLGWLPSTAASVGVTIGNRWSEWQGAATMLARGRGREFAGVAWGVC